MTNTAISNARGGDAFLISDAGIAIYKIYFKQRKKLKLINKPQMLLWEQTHPLGEPENCQQHLIPWWGGLALQETLDFRPGIVVNLRSWARALARPLISQALRKCARVNFLICEMCIVVVPTAWLTASIK